MKKAIFVIFSLLLLSCVTGYKMTYRETSQHNIVDLGSYQVLINKNFKPIGDLSGQMKSANIDNDMGTPTKIERLIFVDDTSGRQNVSRCIVVLLHTIQDGTAYFRRGASYDHVKHRHFEKGYTKLTSRKVAYLIRPSDRIDPKIMELGQQYGYKMDRSINYGVESRIGFVVGSRRLLEIAYLEGSQHKYDYESALKTMTRMKGYISLVK